MTQNENPKKRSPVGIVILVLILTLLLLLLGGAGFVYYSVVKAPLALDDPQSLAASEPMSPGERFQFSSADQTVQVKLDKGDLWSLILAHAGADFLDAVDQELEPYDLYVSGCAIHMDEAGLRLDVELYYQNIRLAAKVPCVLEVSGRRFTLTPTAVKLGVVELPVEKLLPDVKLEYELELPVLSEVTQVSFAEDALILTGSMEQDIRGLVPVNETLYQTAVFSETMQFAVDCLITEDGYATLLTHLEQEPGSVEKVYRDLFTLAKPETTMEYLFDRFGMTQRFFPGIDFFAAEAEYAALTEQLGPLSRSLEQFFTEVNNEYRERKFQLSDGEFLKNGSPFQASQYSGKYEALFQLLDPEEIFLILVDAEDGYIRTTSSFYRMAEEGLEFTQSVDYNKTYILGCVIRSVDGDPFLIYDAEVQNGNTYSRSTKLLPLTEGEVSELQVPGKFGIWTDA